MDEILDTKAAADLLTLSAGTLNKLRCRGGGPVFLKLGHRIAYAKSDLIAWAAERRRVSTSACR